jgi:NitT/TauT family transport system substrate-binding protein
LFNRDTIQLQVVQFAHVSAAGSPLYVIAAAPQSSIKTSKDLAGVEIGISQGSIIDYATNRILSGEGLTASQIKTLAVPKIPDRMSLLLSGQLKAATLPQPFATLAIQQGAVAIVDDTKYPDIGNSVVSFRKKFIDEHPQAVRGFVEALNQATADVNANPEKYRSLLAKYKVVTDTVLAGYPIPRFPTGSLPNARQFEDVVSFAIDRKLIQGPVKYGDSVNGNFLKK